MSPQPTRSCAEPPEPGAVLTRGAGRRYGPPRRATIRSRGRFGGPPEKDSAGRAPSRRLAPFRPHRGQPVLPRLALRHRPRGLARSRAVSRRARPRQRCLLPRAGRGPAPGGHGLRSGRSSPHDRRPHPARGGGLTAPRRRHHRHRARGGPRDDRARLRGELHGSGGALSSLVRRRPLHHRAVVDLRALESRHAGRRHPARRGHRAGGLALGVRLRHRGDRPRRRALPPPRSRRAARPRGGDAPRRSASAPSCAGSRKCGGAPASRACSPSIPSPTRA